MSATLAIAAIIELTFEDLHLRGTQVGDVDAGVMIDSSTCAACHGNFSEGTDPHSSWSGSLMGQAGRDPLFFAQMALANQDTVNAGYFCMRCHVPNSYVTGHAMQPDGSTLAGLDLDGVSCHFCHSMVDPIYQPGVSPSEDEGILAGLAEGAPGFYGNSMFVLDPLGRRRGARPDPAAPHPFIYSPFHATGNFCGTCHEVGNVAVSRQPNGTFRYNALNQRTPSENPHDLFPLERTFSEWRLSAFASGGVDLGGRFGGSGVTVVSSCQDCHMPRTSAQTCFFGPERPDARRHDFAGASAQVLDIIAAFTADDPEVNQQHLAIGRAKAVDMLQRAASLSAVKDAGTLLVRVTNQTGHKLPTGHIEGRRVWINVVFRDAAGATIREFGAYDYAAADLDAASTRVYEMRVGLSPEAAALTGLPAGPTTHMALADTIELDNRIPPRGFANSAYEAAGAPAVGHAYADGQYWDDARYPAPAGTRSALVRLYYQNTPKEYIEHLRDANTSNHWGDTLHDLWVATGRGAPIEMASVTLDLCLADYNGDQAVNSADFFDFLTDFFSLHARGDFNRDGSINSQDFFEFLGAFFTAC
ncbi:MAG: GC-type dockerin domain-anchored protein [Phycisphaerales bacterium]